MPEQDPKVRAGNFEEVSKGYTAEMAVSEAQRCLNCKHRPCVSGCPVNVKIPDFIAQIANGNFEGAYQTIYETNGLPAVCGRVCPQEHQCEAKCVRAIKGEAVAIGRLERFAADTHRESAQETTTQPPRNGHKVAVVGSGPAGLTCAADLNKLGYSVTVFEAFHTAGGVLMYGIPEFRLPKSIVQREIQTLKDAGVDIQTNMVIGRILDIDELLAQGFEAVFVGTGAGLPLFLGIPGEGLSGVLSANEFLTRINLMKAYRPEYDTPAPHGNRVAVVGGGNVAMDAARCAKRLGAEKVFVVYRRGEEEMPARLEEIHHAKEEGIEFLFLTAPVAIHGDEQGRVSSLECVSMELGEADTSGRRRPKEIVGSNHELSVDMVVAAIGNSPNPLIRMTTKG
ncbi:MAG: NADPH-dependent glutamate synthase, partial [Clostridia bacterium]|nr:NADPH-dependent glutamate synthase [Clostridia bacterium]